MRLEGVSKSLDCSPEQLAADILSSYFGKSASSKRFKHHDKRSVPRKNVHIDAVVQMPSGTNEFMYTSAVIKNLSLCGMCAEIPQNKPDYDMRMRDYGLFDVMFAFPCDNEMLMFNCEVRYMAASDKLIVGGAFVSPDIYTLRHLVKYLLTSPCEIATNDSACRSCLQMSGLPTAGNA